MFVVFILINFVYIATDENSVKYLGYSNKRLFVRESGTGLAFEFSIIVYNIRTVIIFHYFGSSGVLRTDIATVDVSGRSIYINLGAKRT